MAIHSLTGYTNQFYRRPIVRFNTLMPGSKIISALFILNNFLFASVEPITREI